MVILVKPNGSTVVENDVIGLGTTVGKIAIVAQSRPGAFVEVMFSPPSGTIIPPVYAAPMMSIDAEDLGIYLCDIAHGVASESGKVRYQISFTTGNGDKYITPEGTFTVQPGVVSIPPENPTQSMYAEIRNAMISASANYVSVIAKLEKALEASETVEANLEEISAAKSAALQAASNANSSKTAASASAASAAESFAKAESEANRARSEADRANSIDVYPWARKPNPPTPAEIGAAPAGFGVGTVNKMIDDPDSVTESGLYQFVSDKLTGSLVNWYLISQHHDDGYAHQIAINVVYGYELRRTKTNNVWGEWEWVATPMQLGVEYRTTERWKGKPVYVKMVDCGEMPSAGTHKNIVVSTGLPYGHKTVGMECVFESEPYGEYALKRYCVNYCTETNNTGEIKGLAWTYSIDSTISVTIKALGDITNYTAVATVKYVK